MFHGVSFRLLHNPPIEQITAMFARLRQDGCDAVSIIPHHYVSLEPNTANLTLPPADWQPRWFIYPDVGQDPTHPFRNTPEPELVLAACQAAASLGMQVMLKPHVDSYQAAWRGFISVEQKKSDWAWGYRNRFLQRYLDIARQVDGTILCLGCELYTVTKELGAEFWIGLAQWVRQQGFNCPLTYAANWGWDGDAEYNRLKDLWRHLDYIGVDAYFPLVPQGYSGPTDTATLLAAWHRKGIDQDWCSRIDDDLLALSRSTGQPLLFTEIGYANSTLAPFDPARDSQPGDPRDDALQLRLGEAFRQRWGHESSFAGYFWWEAWLDQASKPPVSHDIIDRPIEQVIFQPLPGESGAGAGEPLPTGGVVVPPPVVLPPVQPAPQPTPAPALTVDQILAINGIHGPNCPFDRFASVPNGPPEGAAAAWQRVAAGQARWIKLLAEDHRRADAEQARARGLKVLLRAPGEGIVHWEDVLALIGQYKGVCDVIEVGNEPFPGGPYGDWDKLLWNHAVYVDEVWRHCAQAAHDARILLCTPGWQGEREPPGAGTVIPPPPAAYTIGADLANRLLQVYGQYDAIGVHAYSVDVLAIDPILARIDRWHAFFNKPIFLTEYGIAARRLPGVDPAQSDAEKACRYAEFVRRLAERDYIKAAFAFILNGTVNFAAFNAGDYDPNGVNSYWLSDRAWAVLGNELLNSSTRDLAPGARGLAPTALAAEARGLGGRHIGWNDRPHGPDYPVESVPTISPPVFASVLQGHRSPALQQADAIDYYRIAMNRGINPAVALAFFEHESTCGTDGPVAAAGANNWGNLRPRSSDGGIGRGVRVVSTQFGNFRGYNNYKDSLQDWCDLLLGALYRGKSIRQALQVYAPASDQNNPNSYASIVLRRIAQWDQQSGDFDIPGDGTPTPPGPIFTTQVTDYPLLAPPSIAVQTFSAALQAAHSPVLDEADGPAYFQLCTANGVDPAVALAFFQLESNCGTAPGAAERKNWGNLWDAQANAVQVYPSWQLSLRDWCNRLQGPAYTRLGPPTIKRIVPIYQPAQARQNGNDWYIAQLSMRIGALVSAPRDLAAAPADDSTRDLSTWHATGGDGASAGTRGLAPAAADQATAGPDYPVAGPPTISPAVFAAVLQEYQSPVLAEAPADDYYLAAVQAGIDPAVALAVFDQESICGTDRDSPTVLADAKNWGNLRPRASGDTGHATHTVQTPYGPFRGYDRWIVGLQDWCSLLAGPPYAGKSVREALRIYAPSSDSGDPNSYANSVLRRMAAWAEQSGEFTPPGPAVAEADARALGGAEARGLGVQPKWVGADAANYTKGRGAHTPIAIVNHEMQGTLAGTQQAFWNPRHQASAHYGVGKDGTIVQYVSENDMAYANGPIRNPNLAAVPWIADAQRNGTNPNRLTVTIEWEGMHSGDWTQVTWGGKTFDVLKQGAVRSWFVPTEAQYQAGLALIRAIAARWNIPFDRAHICRHSDFDSVTKWFCPGQGFPMPRLLADLNPAPAPPPPEPEPPTPPPSDPYSLLGMPTIPLDIFAQALADVNSPVLAEADARTYFEMCVANNVDPAVALAFFQQESNCGTLGDAASRKNWGNLWDAGANAVQVYPSWLLGLRDWCARLQGPAYTAHGTPTVASIVPIYAPAGARQNGNDAYISQVQARIDNLRSAPRGLGLADAARDLAPAAAPAHDAGPASPAPATEAPAPTTPPAGQQARRGGRIRQAAGAAAKLAAEALDAVAGAEHPKPAPRSTPPRKPSPGTKGGSKPEPGG